MRLDVSIAGARRARVGPRAPMLRRLGRNPLPRLATKTATLDMFPVCTTTRRSFTRVYTPYSDCFVGATRTFRGRRRRAVRFDRAEGARQDESSDTEGKRGVPGDNLMTKYTVQNLTRIKKRTLESLLGSERLDVRLSRRP